MREPAVMMRVLMAAAARRAWVVVALVFLSTVSGGVSVGCEPRSCGAVALAGLAVTRRRRCNRSLHL
jgi:hypothetical protein